MDCYCNSATKIIEIPLKSSSTKLTKLDSGSTIIELLNVKNPGIPSFGTGNFQIKTFSTGQSVDINGNFGTIGISPALIPHSKYSFFFFILFPNNKNFIKFFFIKKI